MVRRFKTAVSVADSLILTSDHEMITACGHGSQIPHYRMPLVGLGSRLMSINFSGNRLGVIVSGPADEKRVAGIIERLHKYGLPQRVEIVVRSTTDLYSEIDWKMQRWPGATVRMRMGGECDAVLFMGDSEDHASLIAAYAETDANRVFVESRLSNDEVAFRLGIPAQNVALGQALFQRLVGFFFIEQANLSKNSIKLNPKTYVSRLREIALEDAPWWFEEGVSPNQDGVVSIFFTVAAIEDRWDGARPQRIRNMYSGFRKSGPVISLTSNHGVLNRRGEALRSMLKNGASAGVWYGENSTSPMLDDSRFEMLALMTYFKTFGGSVGWFVRDLHWLSDELSYEDAIAANLPEIRARGIRELEGVNNYADVLFAPSQATAREFDRLIEASGFKPFGNWLELPPALSKRYMVYTSPISTADSLRLLYAGGYGGIYKLDCFWSALSSLDRDWHIDMLTRASESDLILKDLERFKIDPERVHIINDNLVDYVVDPDVIAVLLLDSEYGLSSFPYKTVSYAEKGIRTLIYKDTPSAEFLSKLGLGITVDQKSDALAAALTEIPSKRSWTTALVKELEQSRNAETWNRRIEQILIALGKKH